MVAIDNHLVWQYHSMVCILAKCQNNCGSPFCKYDGVVWYHTMGQAGIMVVIDMSDSTPALHYNSLPRIVEQLILYILLYTFYTHRCVTLFIHFLLYTL